MSSNIFNQVAYLRSSRSFPTDPEDLLVEINKSYVDIANAVNTRIISLFPTTRPVVTGEMWFLTENKRQNGFRQVYTFTAAGNVPHGINTANITQFTKCTGSFTDGTNFYGVIFGSNVAIAGQISFYMTPTNIVILSGAGAPTIVSGTIVLEWITFV